MEDFTSDLRRVLTQSAPPSSGQTDTNIAAYLSVIFILLFAFCIWLVRYLAEKNEDRMENVSLLATSELKAAEDKKKESDFGMPWHTYITCVIGYFCAFGILLLVPIDMSTVLSDRLSQIPNSIGDPTYISNRNEISLAYRTFFDINILMGSFVMVFEEYYNTDGKV